LKSFEGAGLVTAKSLLPPVQPDPQINAKANVQDPKTVVPKSAEVPPFPNLKSEKVNRNKKFEIAALTAGQSGNINSSLTIQFNSDKVRATLRSLKVLNGQMLPLMLYELAQCLKISPRFNSFFFQENIYFYDHINIGVAMDLGEGLKVGVIKDANLLMPIDIYKILTDYSMKYIKNKLTVEEVSEGTVTVTDLSGDNILYFQPLINQNQTIILGFGGDSHLPGHPMSITGVFDHRVLSGRDVANFIVDFKKRILSYESQNFTNLK
jgi:pyruvate/2-oxoglutarate dehydrogenase complex dihydrolipoamide acyltransferase (E2) component